MERQNKTAAKSQETVFMYRLRFNSLKAFNTLSHGQKGSSVTCFYTPHGALYIVLSITTLTIHFYEAATCSVATFKSGSNVVLSVHVFNCFLNLYFIQLNIICIKINISVVTVN